MAIVFRRHFTDPNTDIAIRYRLAVPLKDHILPDVPEIVHPHIVAQVNGQPLAKWHDYLPDPDDHVIFYVMPQGGREGGKAALTLVATIGIAYASGGVGTAIAGSAEGATFLGVGATGWGIAFQVTASLGLALISRALFKPPTQNFADNKQADPFYSLTGASNSINTLGQVPRVYGTHKIFPYLITPTLPVLEGDDQWLLAAYDFGYGPLDLSNIKIGDTPISRYEHEMIIHKRLFKNHADVQVDKFNYSHSNSLKLNGRVSSSQQIGAKLNPGAPVTRSTASSPPTTHARIDLYFERGLYSINTANGQYYNRSVSLKIEVNDGFGWVDRYATVQNHNWKGPASIDDSFNCFFGLDGWTQNTRGFIGLRPTTTQIRIQFQSGAPVTPTVTPVHLEIPGFYSGLVNIAAPFAPDHHWVTFVTPPTEVILSSKNFDRIGEASSFASDGRQLQRQFGASAIVTDANVCTLYATRNEPFIQSYEFPLTNPGTAQIRVTKLSPDGGQYEFDDIKWTSLISFAEPNNKPVKPDVEHTVLELKIKATEQLSGSVSNLSAVATSILPVWNGSTWTEQPTNNPAWIYHDILAGSATQKPVDAAHIDLTTLKDWADECDEIVDDSERYQFNAVINSASTVREMLHNVASAGRASPAMRDGKYTVIRESDSPLPVQLVSPKNTSAFSASISYIDPPHALKVEFLDEASDYTPLEERIYTTGYTDSNATRFETLRLNGITRRDIAVRMGRYFMAEALLRRERVTFSMDIENLVAQRGDIILVSNDVLKVGGLPRRVISVTGLDVEVDEEVTGLNAVRYDGNLYSVTPIDAYSFTLPVGTTPPEIGQIIEYGVSSSIVADYVVEEVRPSANLTASITAVEHRPEVLTAGDGVIPDRIPKPGVDGTGEPLAVQGLIATITEFVNENNDFVATVQLNWQPPSGSFPNHYIITLDGVEVDQVTLNEFLSGEYLQNFLTVGLDQTWGVTPVTVSGEVGPESAATVTIMPIEIRPGDVKNFGLNAGTERVHCFWDLLVEDGLKGYQIRYSPSLLATWEEATVLGQLISPTTSETNFPVRVGTYFIKAVNSAQKFSINAAYQQIQIIELGEVDKYKDYVADPFTGLGTFDRTEVVSGELRLIAGETEGWFYLTDHVNFAHPWLTRYIAQLEQAKRSRNDTLDSAWFTPLDKAIPLSGVTEDLASGMDAQWYFKYTEATNPTLDSAWFTPLDLAVPLAGDASRGGDWTRLINADVTAKTVHFALRLQTTDVAYTPIVTAAKVIADWMERREFDTDVTITNGSATTIDFNYHFADPADFADHVVNQYPSVGVTLQTGNAGETIVISNVTNESFDVEVLGATAPNTIDWVAIGYGKEY